MTNNMQVYIPSLEQVGGGNIFKVGEVAKISPFASLFPREEAEILGASHIKGRICVKAKSGGLGHYTPSMLLKVKTHD